ncbi:MAG: hypothetical protein H6Q17_87 [Bacteroidetes bacterium]|nr:hypothetical protein [Bacteroidota bacterium]
METKSFSTVHLNHLSVDNAYALFQATVELATPVQTVLGEVAKATLARLTNDTNTMSIPIKQAQRSEFTKQVDLLDADRDEELQDIKRDIVYFIKGRDEAKRSAAERIKITFDPYWHTETEPLNTETQSINTLLTKYNASANIQADAKLIGIDTKIAALATKNAAFDALYKTRTADQSSKSATGTASDFRRSATKSYNDFCTSIEQATTYLTNDTTTTLFNSMEQLRVKYNALVTIKKDEKDK